MYLCIIFIIIIIVVVVAAADVRSRRPAGGGAGTLPRPDAGADGAPSTLGPSRAAAALGAPAAERRARSRTADGWHPRERGWA